MITNELKDIQDSIALLSAHQSTIDSMRFSVESALQDFMKYNDIERQAQLLNALANYNQAVQMYEDDDLNANQVILITTEQLSKPPEEV